VKITVTMEMPDQDLETGWFGKPHELAASVRARLDEVYGDDGGAYSPVVRCVDVRTEGGR
jgi:hypothetical protein